MGNYFNELRWKIIRAKSYLDFLKQEQILISSAANFWWHCRGSFEGKSMV